MSTTRDDLNQLLELLPEELSQVLDFVKVLLEEPEDLTDEEWEEVHKEKEEIKRGEWVRWEDVRRTDV
jgi:lipoate-protein ligase A